VQDGNEPLPAAVLLATRQAVRESDSTSSIDEVLFVEPSLVVRVFSMLRGTAPHLGVYVESYRRRVAPVEHAYLMGLSAHEYDAISLLADDFTTGEIAQLLDMDETAVFACVQRAKRHLGTNTLASAIERFNDLSR
jgi:hypothetical protein